MNKQLKISAPVFFTGLITAFFLSSCYYDRTDILYGKKSNNCDTISTVLYSADVVPVLEQKCYGCHAGSSPSGNLAMGTYATDKSIGLKMAACMALSIMLPVIRQCQMASLKWMPVALPL